MIYRYRNRSITNYIHILRFYWRTFLSNISYRIKLIMTFHIFLFVGIIQQALDSNCCSQGVRHILQLLLNENFLGILRNLFWWQCGICIK
jgi:hypothetical protein